MKAFWNMYKHSCSRTRAFNFMVHFKDSHVEASIASELQNLCEHRSISWIMHVDFPISLELNHFTKIVHALYTKCELVLWPSLLHLLPAHELHKAFLIVMVYLKSDVMISLCHSCYSYCSFCILCRWCSNWRPGKKAFISVWGYYIMVIKDSHS